jgi:glycine/D-amino acid oxidase-like deaminating enzyme/nitrite reductase/ring-hydroxylating ferredoxin subunit
MHAQQTQSWWTRTSQFPPFPSLQGDREFDVAIVGAGITGLTTAALLKKAGFSCVVLEAGELGLHGTTHRTSAHLTAVLDIGFPDLIRKFGEEAARTAVDAGAHAIDVMENLCAAHHIDCEFRRVDGYQYCEHEDQVEELHDDARAGRDLGLDLREADRVPLPFPVRAAYRLPNQAQFHPLRYLAGLASFVQGDGCEVLHRTRVTQIEYDDPCMLRTARGSVRADHVVLATHTPLGVYLTLHPRLVPYRSYCMVVELPQGLAPGLYWDLDDPYHYIRNVGQPSDRLALIGGADHKTGHAPDDEGGFEALKTYIRSRFAPRAEICRWSSEFFEPSDGLPYVGRAPNTSNVFLATGYSGTGLTFGTAAAVMMANQIQEHEDPWSAVFDSRRLKLLAGAKRTAEELGATVKGIVVDRLTELRTGGIADLQPGDGVVTLHQGRYVAACRDHANCLHAVSATCTHMGCRVEWNAVEQQWDCPCHGSIFAPDGSVVSGPALTPLAAVSIEGVAATERAAASSEPQPHAPSRIVPAIEPTPGR